jgi:homoserine O-acetyltransferase
MRTSLSVFFLLGYFVTLAPAQELQVARLGDFKLDSGEVIHDCRIAYRTLGQLNPAKSNAILFPSWFSGNSESLLELIGPGRLADTDTSFVIAADALGDGVSSSPSNSTLQPRMTFPKFSIRDMVRSQHELITHVLHIDHLRAVIGLSMGGMQTFQWIITYPDFMDKAIPITGSPRLAAWDLMVWQAENDAIMNDPAWKKGDYTENPAKVAIRQFEALTLTTPDRFDQEHSRQQVAELLLQYRRTPAFDANDHIRQSQAMMTLDVSEPFGGSMEKAAAAVKARVLIIVSRRDMLVTPGPALEFAKLMHAQVIEMESDCGHIAPGCEPEKLIPAVTAFLGN